MCGDSHDKAVDRSRSNVQSLSDEKNIPIDIIQWNAMNLPLQTASVDVFVTDLVNTSFYFETRFFDVKTHEMFAFQNIKTHYDLVA